MATAAICGSSFQHPTCLWGGPESYNLLTQQDILLASLESGSQHKTQGDGSLGWTSWKKRSWGGGAGQDHTAARRWRLRRGRKWHRNKGGSCHRRQIIAAGATVFRVDYLAILLLNWFYTTSWLQNWEPQTIKAIFKGQLLAQMDTPHGVVYWISDDLFFSNKPENKQEMGRMPDLWREDCAWGCCYST